MDTVVLPVKVYQLIGGFVIFVVGVAITAFIWNWVGRKFKERNNRREDKPNGNQHWTVQMLVFLERLNDKTDNVHKEVAGLNRNLMNGLSKDIQEIKGVMIHCRQKSESKEKVQ